MMLDVLAVTDEVDNRIYSQSIGERMGDVTLVLSCGDVPASYLEFLTDALRRSSTMSWAITLKKLPAWAFKVNRDIRRDVPILAFDWSVIRKQDCCLPDCQAVVDIRIAIPCNSRNDKCATKYGA